MITVYLCDDNPTILTQYRERLFTIKEKHHIPMKIQTFTSGSQLLFHMEEKDAYPDIIYLDILMDDENGIEVAKHLRNIGYQSEIIFLTANPEYVFESFEATPAHYIVKDSISDDRFEEIFLKTKLRAEKQSSEVFTCSGNGVQRHIPVREISYFEVSNRITTVHYNQEYFSFYARLDDLEQQFSKHHFIRVHRAFLVHLPYIEEVDRDSLLLSDKTSIPLGATYAKAVKQALNEYFRYLV